MLATVNCTYMLSLVMDDTFVSFVADFVVRFNNMV